MQTWIMQIMLCGPQVEATAQGKHLKQNKWPSLGMLPSYLPDLHLLRIFLVQHVSHPWNSKSCHLWFEVGTDLTLFPIFSSQRFLLQDSFGWLGTRWSHNQFHHEQGLPCLVSGLIVAQIRLWKELWSGHCSNELWVDTALRNYEVDTAS